MPLVDCAPIAVARETGLFKKHGLDVELQREPGWATIRDKLAYGELEAAHALVGLAFALSWGMGVIRTPSVTGYLLNSNGDAITVSRALHERGVRDAATLAAELRQRQDRPAVFGVPHLFSTHHFLLRRWLKPAGIVPGRDVQIMVLPPSQMVPCLQAGNIDGYCVGEPFNTLGVRRENGVILAESNDLWPLHPEKALIVTEKFATGREEEHLALIRAISEAARICETREGRLLACRILSQSDYLDLDEGVIRASLILEDDESLRTVRSENFHVFHHPEVNEPTSEKASWVINHLRDAGLLEGAGKGSLPKLRSIFREDIHRKALAPPKKKSPSRKSSLKTAAT